MTPKTQPRVHFSFRSPFSWLAITVLRRRVPDLDDRVTFVPFWNPDAVTEAALRERGAELHYAPMSKAKHPHPARHERQAARVGVPMRWPIDDDPWWAAAPGLAGCPPGRPRPAVLRGGVRGPLGARRGHLHRRGGRAHRPGGGARPRTGGPGHRRPADRAEAVDRLEQAYHDDIFGIPYFRVGRHRFWGLDRVDDFVAELEHPTPVRRPAPAGAARRIGAYDTDTAGGCG
ncbi:disulfide bond formation protein DsbA [Micromonospora sp. BRA006-A]|nr:disulfide bond formation protein DsbA [Micromonospora sp. BRA006-A]